MSDAAIGCWPLDEPFPAVLRDVDLMRVLGIGRTRFFQLKKAGRFDRLIARPALTKSTRYSGALVKAWAQGELSESRYFQGARRQVQLRRVG